MSGNDSRDKKQDPYNNQLFTGQETRNKFGFTLIEVLVVLGLFSILSVIIINVFLLSLGSQRQASFRQKTLANLRYVMEIVGRQVRISEIDYSSFNYTGDDQSLYLIDQEGDSYIFYLADGEFGRKEIKMSVNGQESFLTSGAEVDIVNLSFIVDPVLSPFIEERCNQDSGSTGCSSSSSGCTVNDPGNEYLAGFCQCTTENDCPKTQNCSDPGLCLPVNYHPRVTIVLGFESVGLKVEEQKLIYLQTTASSRVYKR